MSDTIPDYPAYDKPPEYDAGLDFNYDRWTPGTKVTLTNVPWDSNYKDIVAFGSAEAVDAYINKQATQNVTLDQLAWAKPGMPLKLPMTINAVERFNYIRVENPRQADSGVGGDLIKYFYYFITSAEWGSPNSTIVTVQMDMWCTYHMLARFGNCYIEQGHIGIANERQFENNGREFLTVPEGLDVGSEYQTVEVKSRGVMSGTYRGQNDPPVSNPEWDGFSILICTTVSITEPARKENGAPNLITASGDYFQGLPSGAEYYIFETAAQFSNFMSAFRTTPWITEGIVSITAIPKPARYGYELEQMDMSFSDNDAVKRLKVYKMKDFFGFSRFWSLAPQWRNNGLVGQHIPARYSRLRKFMTFPYLVIELTTFTGTPVILKPEAWTNDNGDVNEKAALVPPNQRIVFTPLSYNARTGAEVDRIFGGGKSDIYDDKGDYLDMATQITNFPSLAMVNNGALSFMASNFHGIAYQHQSADWSQHRAGMSAVTSFGQAGAGQDAVSAQGDISRGADAQATNIGLDATWNSAGVGALGSVGGGIASGIASGSPGAIAGGATSAAMSLIQTGIAANATSLQQGLRNRTSLQSQDVVLSQMKYNQDSNYALARFTQRGDYSNAVAAINARVQDAKLTQPSTSGQVGGEAFGIIHNASQVSLRFKLINPAAMRMIGEYWLRYGYRVMQYGRIPAGYMVMRNFTYWKLTETYLTGPMTETAKAVIRGIFEKGVTVWSDPDKIGNIDMADNAPLTGIRL